MTESAASVLVVDDERFFREAIQEVLAADGLDCRTAATAGEAVEQAEDPEVGVVVLDIQLPDRNGLDVLRRLREVRPAVRVVVLSAHTDQEYVLEALRLGACDYLAKPLHEEELRLSVRRALETFRVAARSEALRVRVERIAEEAEGLVAAVQADGPEGLAARAAQAAARLLDAGKTSVILVEGSGRELHVAGTSGHKVPLEQLAPTPVGDGVAGWAVARGETLVVPDVAADPRFAGRAQPDRYSSASFVVVPIGRQVTRWGALCATDRAGGEPFAAEDAALLGVLGQLLVPLLRPEEPAAGESDAAAVTVEAVPAPVDGHDELARLVCEAVSTEVEPARLLASALRAVGRELAAAPVSLYLVDAEGRLAREAQWEGAGASDRASLPADQGLTGSVFETGQPVASESPAEDPRFAPEADTAEEGGPGPLLIVPLRFRGKILGVCRAFPEPGRPASPRAAEVLGAALSAAVRSVLLYRSLVGSIEEVARVRREGRRPS